MKILTFEVREEGENLAEIFNHRPVITRKSIIVYSIEDLIEFLAENIFNDHGVQGKSISIVYTKHDYTKSPDEDIVTPIRVLNTPIKIPVENKPWIKVLTNLLMTFFTKNIVKKVGLMK